jgi:hypothetical protein
MALDRCYLAATWLLGDSPETVRYDTGLGGHGNLDVFRLLRTILLSCTLSNGIVTKVLLLICLATNMIDWKQKLKNQWVQIEINQVQPGKTGNL